MMMADLTEEKSTNLQRLKKVLLKIEGVLLIVSVALMVLFFLNVGSLNLFGIYFYANSHGESMLPTLTDGTLFLAATPEYAPFSELEVGDIIAFRERMDRGSVTVKMEPKTDGDKFWVEVKGVENNYSPEFPQHDEGIKYTQEHIMHRIVEIREADDEGDRAVYTKGDNNDGREPWPVMESGYESKVLWYCNYIGWPVHLIFETGAFIWLFAVTSLIGAIILIGETVQSEKEKKLAAETTAETAEPSDPQEKAGE